MSVNVMNGLHEKCQSVNQASFLKCRYQSSTERLKGEQPTKAEEDMYECMYV